MSRSTAATEKWRRIIQEQASSGQTVALFSRQRGIAASSLFAWKRRLSCTAGAAAFVEARLGPRDQGQQEPGAGIEIHLPGQRRILVQRGFDPATLGAVISTLEASS